jgi:hypothetical protein
MLSFFYRPHPENKKKVCEVNNLLYGAETLSNRFFLLVSKTPASYAVRSLITTFAGLCPEPHTLFALDPS